MVAVLTYDCNNIMSAVEQAHEHAYLPSVYKQRHKVSLYNVCRPWHMMRWHVMTTV